MEGGNDDASGTADAAVGLSAQLLLPILNLSPFRIIRSGAGAAARLQDPR